VVILFFYPWSTNVATGLGASISVEAASIMVAPLGSAVILKRGILIDVLCQGSLFSVPLSLVAALILWYDSANNLYKSLHLIHACLIYPLLMCIGLYLFTFTQTKKPVLNTGIFK
jgi:hypothetical protein